MTQSNTIAGLDIGGGRVTCIIAAEDPETETLRVLAGSSKPCRGLKGGVVVDIRETANSISQAVEEAENIAEEEIDSVFLGVRGVHLLSQNSHGAYNIARADREISADDVQATIENAKAIPIAADREIIQVIPQSFSIDRQRGVPNPEGMEGSLLEVDVHIVTASSSHLNNIVKSVAKAGLRVEETYYSLLTLGECVLTAEEKELGTILMDMGGENLSVGIFVDGGIKFSREIPYGCDLITRDIAYALHTSRDTARELKEKYGVAISSLLGEDGEIPVPSLDRNTSHNIKASFLLDIIQPRAEELFDKMRDEVQKSRYADVPGLGVLTGGGALLRGMNEQCARSMGLREIRQAQIPRDAVMSDDEYFHPTYTTAMSLVIYPHLRLAGGIDSGSPKKAPFIGKVTDFFKSFDLFGGD